MALPIIRRSREDESRHPRGLVFFPGDHGAKIRGKFRGAVLRGFEKLVGEITFEFGEIFPERREFPMRRVVEQKL